MHIRMQTVYNIRYTWFQLRTINLINIRDLHSGYTLIKLFPVGRFGIVMGTYGFILIIYIHNRFLGMMAGLN